MESSGQGCQDMGEGHPQAGDGCWAQVPAGEAPARDTPHGRHASLYWTGAHLGHLDLPSPQDVSSLMPSAAFGLVDHSHLDTPELTFLAFKTPASPLPPSLGLPASFLPSPTTSQSSLCPCSLYPLTFSGLRRAPLNLPLHRPPGNCVHCQPVAASLLPACPRTRAGEPPPSCSFPCVCCTNSQTQRVHSRKFHLPIFVGVKSMTPHGPASISLSSAGLGAEKVQVGGLSGG